MSSKPEQSTQPKKRRRKQTIAEARQQMADSGDVEGLWQVLSTQHWSEFDHAEVCHLLLRAIDVSSRADPAAFASEAYRRLVGFSTYLLLRVQQRMLTAIDYGDQRSQSYGPSELSSEACNVYLPRLLELQHHLMDLLASQANTARLWALARQRRAGNDCAPEAPAPPSSSPSPHAAVDGPEDKVRDDESQPEPSAHTSAERNGRALVHLLNGEAVNGEPVNRLAGCLNGENGAAQKRGHTDDTNDAGYLW